MEVNFGGAIGRRASKHICLLLILSFFSVVSAGNLQAQNKIKISKNNIDLFRVIKAKFVCYEPEGASPQLGKLNKKGLKPKKRKWKLYNLQKLQTKVSKLQTKIDNRQRVSKTLRKRHKRLSRKLGKIEDYYQQCVGTNPDGQDDGFNGDDSLLDAYTEQLTLQEVNYILDKVAFGGSSELRSIGLNEGLTALVDALVDGVMSDVELQQLHNDSLYWASLNYFYPPDDPGYGRIWTHYSVQIGQMHRLLYSRNPFHEWMLLMLAAHFSTNLNAIDFSFARGYHYGLPLHWKLLRDHAVGNFQELSSAMFLDPAMNFWLDNKDNRIGEPNQNFAREFLELFNLGVDDIVTGLPNYDEESVVATTAFVSGYYPDIGFDPLNGNEVISISYAQELHDPGIYTLFRGIPGAEVTSYMQPETVLQHVLFQHPGAARYIAERFAGQLLYPGLPDGIINSLAATLVAENYELRPFLKRVLKSQAFFSQTSIQSCISSPLEHFVRLSRKLLSEQLSREGGSEAPGHWVMHTIINSAAYAGQHLFEPPSVFGWKNSCNINRSGNIAVGEEWVSAQRLLNRGRGCLEIMNSFNWINVDFLNVIGLENGMSASEIILQVAGYVWNYTPTPEQITVLSRLLTELRDDEGNTYIYDLNLDEDWYVRAKIPRLICLLGDLVDNNLR